MYGYEREKSHAYHFWKSVKKQNRFSINSSLVLFSLFVFIQVALLLPFPRLFIYFYIFACFLEGKLKKQTQTKQNRKKLINISIWATAHLTLI